MDRQRVRHATTAALLAFGATVAADSTAATTVSDWRTAEPFASIERGIERWLDLEADRVRVAWRDAVDNAAPAATLGPALIELTRLVESPVPPSLSASVRLATAERRLLERRYGECLKHLDAIEEADVYSPELRDYLLAVSAWGIVDRERVAAALQRLPSETDALDASLGVARRAIVESLRREVAREAPPLGEVAGLMGDAHRRLALGDADAETQSQQSRALARLDEMIEQLEQQQRDQQASQQGGAGGAGGRPAEESRPSELKADGKTDRRGFAAGDPWGALSPAERERLTQAIARDFPDHYRELIERYFETVADPSANAAEDVAEERP